MSYEKKKNQFKYPLNKKQSIDLKGKKINKSSPQ